MEAIAYIRVSTKEQAIEGCSLDAQEDAIRSYAQMRGFDLVEVIRDEAVSGAKPLDQRPGGARLQEVAREKKVAIIAYKLDRLFRDCADCLNVVKGWDKAGVSLHLLDLGGQAIDTSSAMGRFFLTVMAGAAELERNQIAERTSSTLAYKLSKGEFCGGNPPYGYGLSPDGTRLEKDVDEQRIITVVRKWKARGLSLRKIIKELIAEGFTSIRGRAWHPQKIKQMLNHCTS